MSAGVMYGFARLGLFILCAVPAILLLPSDWDLLLRLLIGAVVSAVLSFVLLTRLRDRVSESMVAGRERKEAEKAKLRSALAGDEDRSS